MLYARCHLAMFVGKSESAIYIKYFDSPLWKTYASVIAKNATCENNVHYENYIGITK